ncbi:NAD-dependent epimerase/dehydratase family protein [Hymenobacter sp. ASUV-10]|uniref:NAD-dependent epimerase/dehydratase family protein n=1 Tax=Hymenobacter aranciens TaxID=3063996 RepID=A0ABT9BBV4_9BACT|nr:NAD-dependent epimerase/dehydratase family protein [Hymenobacter sp. ASUV-10]MDO7875260.1 NAD-dependent epimerase/dehydratase family protein [Hymenobacter sp. ASUV-10]
MIFVTGGTGLIGSYLLRSLRERGLLVRALHRGPVPPAAVPGVEWLPGDLLDTELLREALTPDVTHVFHCAGLVSYAPQDEELLQKINVEGSAAIVDACLERPGIRLAYVSSVAALGSPPARPEGSTGPLSVAENATWDLGAAHPAYATSKYLGELEVWRGVAEGLSAIIVNPSVVLGPGDWSRSSTRLLRYAYEQHRFYTRGLINFVDVRDVVAQLLRLALDLPQLSSERYILSAGAIPLADFFQQAATAMGRRPPTTAVPDWLAEIIWRAEHARAVLTGARPLITKDTARAGRQPTVYANAKVQQATGLPFRPLADTIAWCAAGLRPKPQHSGAVVVS